MNLKIRDEAAFFSEFQNEPVQKNAGEEMLSQEEIAAKLNGIPRGVVPLDCHHVTMFVDVQKNLLYWLTAAWDRQFNGYVLDYGTWPEQKSGYSRTFRTPRTLQIQYPKGGLEAALYAGLEDLCKSRLGRKYPREDGVEVPINRILIDANWGQSTDVVYQFCRQSEFSAQLFPSHGKYVGASGVPFSEMSQRKGDRVGMHWRIPGQVGPRGFRHVLIDTNYWKSFVHARLGVMMGDPGCLSFFGRDPEEHRLISEHLISEYRVRTTAAARTVDEWKQRPSHPENHWLDCLVGAAVAASIEGVTLSTFHAEPKVRKRIRLSDYVNKRAF